MQQIASIGTDFLPLTASVAALLGGVVSFIVTLWKQKLEKAKAELEIEKLLTSTRELSRKLVVELEKTWDGPHDFVVRLDDGTRVVIEIKRRADGIIAPRIRTKAGK
jgi:hypothetical protein